MADSYKGGRFICKVCEYPHIIPWGCIPADKRRTLKIPCLYLPNEYRKYRGYEFKEWTGAWEDFSESLVKPVSHIKFI